MKTGEENQLHNAHLQGILSSEVCNLVEKQVSALSDTQDSLSRVSESAEKWLASKLPPMTDEQSQIFLSGHG